MRKMLFIALVVLLFMAALGGYIGYNIGYEHGLLQNSGQNEIEIEIQPVEIPEPEFKSLGVFTATAYCPCVKCCGKTDGITASGTKATAGRTVAADTSILPFGTEIYIDGNKYIIEDRGGSIKQNKIDIFFNTHQEALQYGRRQVEVFVKNEP